MSMQLAETLAQHNITPEDLEKAASVRVFAKVAAAENIDLAQLTEEQVGDLYADFERNILPAMLQEGDAQQKLASLTQDQAIDLFNKQASAEGLDLSQFDDAQLGEAFAYFVENVLPTMAANDFEPVGAEKQAAIEEAMAKSAEAQILGEKMAMGFLARLEKEAGAEAVAAEVAPGLLRRVGGHIGGALRAKNLREGLLLMKGNAGAPAVAGARRLALRGAAETAAAYGVPVAALTAGGVGLHRRMRDKRGSVELSAEDVQILAQMAEDGDSAGIQKAAEFIVEAGIKDLASAAGTRVRGVAGRAGELLGGTNVRGNIATVAGPEATLRQKGKAYMDILRGKHQGPGGELMTSEARKSLGAQLGALGTVGAGGALALHRKESSVTLNAEDLQILQNLAAVGDAYGLQKAASLIVKAAEDEGVDISSDTALDMLVEERATELAGGWLVENGYAIQE